MPLQLYWLTLLLLFSKKYIVYIILTMMMFVGSQSFISLLSFMFVSAAVSEIHIIMVGIKVFYVKFNY